ncbi:putative oxidoreductase [Leucobacter sp. 7(1)]|uniref:SDR family NAD(P)-dependent oxidoreductase n=1 Tax=Leucobacter sp. 7(1) TaxID=1255613 RepID=UPI00097ED3F8|nr:SDR family NAD(P)-dependent oxidoreductase [Leucobacter sp. 7(1)]SJN08102.1 putative oxidoreductase [Leucobacter sp. 7(1)]
MTHTAPQTIVLTGGSDGIGAAAARLLAGGPARLIIVGRSPAKTAAVAAATHAEHIVADYRSLDDVRSLAATLHSRCERIDVLAHNAGGMFAGPVRTGDGFERTFQVNHLAPVLLTRLLLPLLLESRARIVSTASVGARLFGDIDFGDLDTQRGFTPSRAYGNAKLANILFTKGLHARYAEHGLAAVAFHPGMIATNFAADAGSTFQRLYHGTLTRFLRAPEHGGARLGYFIQGSPGTDWTSGAYYRSPGRIGRSHRLASDPTAIDTHWSQSAEMLGISWPA